MVKAVVQEPQGIAVAQPRVFVHIDFSEGSQFAEDTLSNVRKFVIGKAQITKTGQISKSGRF